MQGRGIGGGAQLGRLKTPLHTCAVVQGAGIAQQPKPFRCHIVPRKASSSARRLRGRTAVRGDERGYTLTTKRVHYSPSDGEIKRTGKCVLLLAAR